MRATIVFAGMLIVLIDVSLPVSCAEPESVTAAEISVELPEHPKEPFVACSAAELVRLRNAWVNEGPEHNVIAGRVRAADRDLERAILFPPRGGQHNQWYQCDTCQRPLKTIDAEHHRCATCGKVYSGYPYDDVLYARTHNANLAAMARAAWAYAITGEEKYAEFAATVMRGYATRYLQYPHHGSSKYNIVWNNLSGGRLFEQTLNEAVALSRHIAPSYDLLRGASALSPQDRQAIRDGLIKPMLKNIDSYRAGKNNWQTWHNAALLMGGAALGERRWIERALNDPRHGFLYQMQASISADGMWYENSWGYHHYALRALLITAEGARRLGVDLYQRPEFLRMFLLPASYVMPDGSLPRFADDVQSRLSGKEDMFELAFRGSGDRRLLPFAAQKPSWETILCGRTPANRPPAPAVESVLVPHAGHAILRTGPLASAFTFGPHGGYHGHYDKLSFVFFGQGRELGVDPGRSASQAYRLPIHKGWYKATLSHNTVLADGRSQAAAVGELLAFEARASRATAIARCDKALAGVRWRRVLYQTPAWLLVYDELASDRPRRFTWAYHNRGKSTDCSEALQPGTPPSWLKGHEYLDGVTLGRTADAVQVHFRDGAVDTHLFLEKGGETDIVAGTGPLRSRDDRVPLVLFTREGKDVSFLAVLATTPAGQPCNVKGATCRRMADAVRLTVMEGSTQEEILIRGDHTLEATSNGKGVLRTAIAE